MEFLEIKDIAEQDMELVNPISVEKVLAAGQAAGMRPDASVIDFGCGYAEPLVLWAEAYGVRGLGIDVRPKAIERAQRKVQARGLSGQIELVCDNAAEHGAGGQRFEPHPYDVAACVGATFIWNGWQPTLRTLKRAIRPGGALLVGEAYWRTGMVPAGYARSEGQFTEHELWQMARKEQLAISFVARASEEDWDRYERGNWQGLLRWLDENPDDAQRDEVLAHLLESQEEYFRYGREFFGWALYVLRPLAGA